MEEILAELDIKCDEEYVARIKEMMGETLATRFINYPMIKEWVEKARENKLIPEYVEAFLKRRSLVLVENFVNSEGASWQLIRFLWS